MDEIEKKMSKIIKKKQIVNCGILKKKLLHICMFFQKNFYKFSEFVDKMSNRSNKTLQEIQ